MIISFDPKMSDSAVKPAAIRLARKIIDSGMTFDIEVAGLIHLFVSACGVTQQELDCLNAEKNSSGASTA